MGPPASTSAPSVPCLHSVFPELESWVPLAPHRHGHQGRRAARMQISEGPRVAPPAGIKGGAGRTPDGRSRCLPGAGLVLPRSLPPGVPECLLQLSLPPLLVRTELRQESEVGSELLRPHRARGDMRPLGRIRTSVGPRGPGVHFLNGNMGNRCPHRTLPGLAGGISPGAAHWPVCPQAIFTQVGKNSIWFVQG